MTAIFLSGVVLTGIPLAFALLFVFWCFTQDASYLDFLNSNDKSTQYVAAFATIFSILVGMVLSLNWIVYLNGKYSWLSESVLKAKLGKELRRYVFVPYS